MEKHAYIFLVFYVLNLEEQNIVVRIYTTK